MARGVPTKLAVPTAIVTLLIALSALGLSIYQQYRMENPPSLQELVAEGDRHFNRGDYQEALVCYEEALESHDEASVWRRKGYALFNLAVEQGPAKIGDLDERPGYAYAMALIESNPGSADFDCLQQCLDLSIESFSTATLRNNEDLDAWLFRGIASLYAGSSSHYCINHLNNAIVAFQVLIDFIESPPAHSVEAQIECCAWQGMGCALLAIEDFVNATRSFHQAEGCRGRG